MQSRRPLGLAADALWLRGLTVHDGSGTTEDAYWHDSQSPSKLQTLASGCCSGS